MPDPSTTRATPVELASPDGTLHATIALAADGATYELRNAGGATLMRGRLGFVADGRALDGRLGARFDTVKRSETEERFPLLGGKAEAYDHATVAAISIVEPGDGAAAGGRAAWHLEARLSDDAFAFRYLSLGVRRIDAESTTFSPPAESACWYFERDSSWKLKSHAGEWRRSPLASMPTISKQGPVQGLPVLFELPSGAGYAFVSEAALAEFSGLRLRAVDAQTFAADLADAQGFDVGQPMLTPWRVIGVARDLDALVSHDAIACLAPPADPRLFADPSFCRPGRSVWRWWSSGTGTPDEERRYLRHAAALGFEYTTIDEGWEKWPDPWPTLAAICAEARAANVGVIVWKHHDQLADPANGYAAMAAFFDRVRECGATGLKVDFLNAETVDRVRFAHACLRLAAERRLVLNFHGIGKPTGESRTWPNELTREAIRGLELNRMSEGPLPPSHNAALPFTRLVVGGGDYTPLTVDRERLGKTTIAHQAATWVAFTSPLQTLAEDPVKLLDDPIMAPIVRLLRVCPTTFDETRVLPGSAIGDLAVLARRKGDRWWIAAINGRDERRRYALSLAFLSGGAFAGELIVDGDPPMFAARGVDVRRGDTVVIDLAPGGGFVCSLHPAVNEGARP